MNPTTPAEINVAIRKFCGWTQNEYDNSLWYHPDSPFCQDGKYANVDDAPDYHGSLDAMHEAEKTLTVPERAKYQRILIYKFDATCFATAPQRCAAFLAVKQPTK